MSLTLKYAMDPDGYSFSRTRYGVEDLFNTDSDSDT
jgi:hypothetical protein